MKFLSLLILVFFILINYCCNSATTDRTELEITSKQQIHEAIDSSGIDQFMLQCNKAQPAELIPLHFCEKYIKPALADQQLHPYLPFEQATYSYGQIEYEDKSIVVISFYYKATNGLNLLQASFLASYNKSNNDFIDSKMVFGSSAFDFQKSKGYNMGLLFRSERKFTDTDSIIFIQHSTEKKIYSQFKKGIKIKKNSLTERTFILYKNGQFKEK